MVDPISAVSAGVGALGGILSLPLQAQANRQNQRNFETNIALQRELQYKQLQFQKDMYEDAKLYNSIPNQANQYRQAGLNPLAMMDKGNSFAPATAMTGGSASAPAQPNIQALHPDFTGLQNGLQSMVDNRIKTEQARNLQYENDFKIQKLQLEISDRIKELELKSNKSDIERQELKRLQMMNHVYGRMQDDLVTQQHWDAKKTFAEFVQTDIENQYNKAVFELRQELLDNQVRLSRAQISQINAVIAKTYQEINNLVLEGKLTAAETQKVIQQTNNLFQEMIIKKPEEHRSLHQLENYNSSIGWLENTLDDANRSIKRILGRK